MRSIITSDPRLSIPKEDRETISPVIINLVGVITEEVAAEFRITLSEAESAAMERKQGVLPVVVDTFGGDVYALLGIIDAMDSCSLPISTIAESKAMSCGAVILSCGTPGLRFAAKNSTIMIHDISGWISGKIKDIETEAAELNRLHRALMTRLSKNCGKPPKFFDEEIHRRGRSDWYITARQAKSIGLVDHVGQPMFHTHVSVEYSFTKE